MARIVRNDWYRTVVRGKGTYRTVPTKIEGIDIMFFADDPSRTKKWKMAFLSSNIFSLSLPFTCFLVFSLLLHSAKGFISTPYLQPLRTRTEYCLDNMSRRRTFVPTAGAKFSVNIRRRWCTLKKHFGSRQQEDFNTWFDGDDQQQSSSSFYTSFDDDIDMLSYRIARNQVLGKFIGYETQG